MTTDAPESGSTLPLPDVAEQLERLSDLPVSGHAAVFETIHDRLRRALDATPPDAAETV